MLGKLLKYDFRALGRVMIPLQLGVLLAGVFGSILMNVSLRSINSRLDSLSDSSVVFQIIEATTSMMAMLLFTAVFASIWVTLFLIARHLYKSFMSDEGYLTFTLPVTANQNLLSKAISGSVWLLINAVVLIIVTLIFALIGFTETGIVNIEVIHGLGEIFSAIATPVGILTTVEVIVFCLIALLFSVMQIYMSLIVGGSLARTHKVMAAVGIYFLASFIVQTVMSFILFGSMFTIDSISNWNSAMDIFVSLQPIVLPQLFIYIAFVVGFYLFSLYMLNRKLDID